MQVPDTYVMGCLYYIHEHEAVSPVKLVPQDNSGLKKISSKLFYALLKVLGIMISIVRESCLYCAD
jgi:hypothetical protein